MPSHAQPLRSRAGGHDRSDRACKVDDTRLMVPCRAWLGMANPKAAASGGWRICAGISPKASHRRHRPVRRARRRPHELPPQTRNLSGGGNGLPGYRIAMRPRAGRVTFWVGWHVSARNGIRGRCAVVAHFPTIDRCAPLRGRWVPSGGRVHLSLFVTGEGDLGGSGGTLGSKFVVRSWRRLTRDVLRVLTPPRKEQRDTHY
jgi:hypothetical protein